MRVKTLQQTIRAGRILPVAVLLLAAQAMFGQQSAANASSGASKASSPKKDELTQARIDEIIQKFAAKEADFAQARARYTYRQTARIQELDSGGRVTGKWEEVSDIVFEDRGRTERVLRAPVSTLHNIILTPEDLQDLRDVQPFVLTTTELPEYNITYLGREKIDEIGTYAFAVRPKDMQKGKRYFAGIVWVDDLDLQIVKTYGRGVGIVKKNNEFPKFETYREQIDGKYWFPTYTIAESALHFESGDQQIRQVVKYEDYKQFGAESSIKFDLPDEDGKPAEPAKPGTPGKSK